MTIKKIEVPKASELKDCALIVVKKDFSGGDDISRVPVMSGVSSELKKVMIGQLNQFRSAGVIPEYEPGEKYSRGEMVSYPLAGEGMSHIKKLVSLKNVGNDSSILDVPEEIDYYMVRFSVGGEKIYGFKKADKLRVVLQSKGFFVRKVDDRLQEFKENILEIASDFDFVIYKKSALIMAATFFERIGRLQGEITKSVAKNMPVLKEAMPYLEVAALQSYASEHPRAAQRLSAVISRGEHKGIEKDQFVLDAADNGIQLIVSKKGQIKVADGQQLDFFDYLNNRRYAVRHYKAGTRRYVANSRKQVSD